MLEAESAAHAAANFKSEPDADASVMCIDARCQMQDARCKMQETGMHTCKLRVPFEVRKLLCCCPGGRVSQVY